jgi:hypothetical protein
VFNSQELFEVAVTGFIAGIAMVHNVLAHLSKIRGVFSLLNIPLQL